MIRNLTRVALVALSLAFLSLPALAQSTDAEMDTIVKNATEAGMKVIVIEGDTAKNAAAEAAAAEEARESIMMRSQERANAFRESLQERLSRAPALIEELVYIVNFASPSGHYSDYFVILLWTLLLLVISEQILRQTLGRRVLGPWFIGLQTPNPIGYTQKLPILLLRTLMAVVALVIVVIISYGLGYVIFGTSDNGIVRLTVAYIYLTYLTARFVVFLWRMILAPYLEQYRVPHFSDKDARKLFYWLLIVASIGITLQNFVDWIEELGVGYDIHALMQSALTFVTVLLNVAMVLANRKAISKAVLNGQDYDEVSVAAKFFSRAWAPGVIAYFFIAWSEMTYRLVLDEPLGIPLINGFYVILLTVLVVYGLVGYLIERFFNRRRLIDAMQHQAAEQEMMELSEELGDDLDVADMPPPAQVHTMRTFEDLSRRLANILALFAGGWALIEIWQIDIDMMAGNAATRSYDVFVVLLIGYIIYHGVRIWIDQKIQEEGGDEIEITPGDEGGAGSASRLATLLPLFRNFLLVVIVVTVTLIALTDLGVNVAPLFAGAGVVGLAIGFGSQTLVRDIFSGAFFLFDDAFRKGEYIDIGTVKGTVEKISPRSFQLRHHLGPLHTVPFGEIQYLTNFSRDWVMMKLKLRVTYDTDVEKVRKLVKKLGQDLLNDEVVGPQFIQPLKSQGVIEMQDSAMIIRVKFMTKPGDQWVLRKRVYQEIRDLFAREGIKFAHREVTVRIADEDSQSLTQKQKDAVGAAVLAMEDQDEEEAGGGSDRD